MIKAYSIICETRWSGVMAWACMASSGSGLLLFIDDVTEDRSSRMNSEVYKIQIILSAQIQSNSAKLIQLRFIVQMDVTILGIVVLVCLALCTWVCVCVCVQGLAVHQGPWLVDPEADDFKSAALPKHGSSLWRLLLWREELRITPPSTDHQQLRDYFLLLFLFMIYSVYPKTIPGA